MGKRSTAARVSIEPGTADELGVPRFDSLDGVEDHFHVGEIDLTVAIQVGHLAVAFLVDEDVRRISELMAAVTGAALAANGEVVRRSPEPGANSHPLGV